MDLLANWRSTLDDRACAILEEAGREITERVLADLKLKLDDGEEIMNPSAYVLRAMATWISRRGSSQPSPAKAPRNAPAIAPRNAPTYPPPQRRVSHQAGRDMLDKATLEALDGLAAEDRASILDDLTSRADVRNPSAFVWRAVLNVRQRAQRALDGYHSAVAEEP